MDLPDVTTLTADISTTLAIAGRGNGSASEKKYNRPAGSGIHQEVTSESTGRATNWGGRSCA